MKSSRLLLLAVLLLAVLAGGGASAGPDPATAPTPEDWLLLPPTDPGGRTPFRASAVFARYLLEPDAAPPADGEIVRGSDGREVAWRPAAPDAEGRVGPGDALWAYAVVSVPEEGTWLLRVERAAVVFLNGRPVYGDVYGHGITRTPVALRAGENRLFAAAFRGPFRVGFEAPPKAAFVDALDPTLPDLVAGETLAPHAGVVLVNAHAHPARTWNVEARVEAGAARVATGLRIDGVPELTRRKEALVFPAFPVPTDATSARLVVTLADCDGVLDERSFPLEVRQAGDVRRRTFVSAIDGSVQAYAVRPPAGDDGAGEKGLVLTLHGAGVDCLGQARAYAPKPDLWIVAPTNRRPFGFDWQDWGRQDAYEVLADALARTGVDRHRVWLTGHSMGGHGTWHLAVNDADGFGAVAPSAGWVSFDTYGDRGNTAGPLDRLWRASDPAADTLALLANLRDVPIRQLHGADDDNVPVSEARRMEAALADIASDYRLDVVPGKGHWWDGEASPGVDCVDWPAFFEAFRAHPIPRDPETLRFVTADVAVDSRHHWIRVLQPLQQGEPLAVEAARRGESLDVTTTNVRRLVLEPPSAWGTTQVRLDGKILTVRAPGPWGFVKTPAGWEAAAPSAPAAEKRPERAGPFKRAFDRDFVLVAGTRGDDAEDARGLERARYDAERWLYRANGRAELVTDAAFLAAPDAYAGRNVVLYGNADTNAAWDAVLPSRCPLRLARGAAKVGTRDLEGDDLAAFFVYPRRDDDHALVGVVAWTGPAGERASILSSYLASGVGYPDYVVFDRGVLEKGDYGVKSAGLFDVTWNLAE